MLGTGVGTSSDLFTLGAVHMGVLTVVRSITLGNNVGSILLGGGIKLLGDIDVYRAVIEVLDLGPAVGA